MVITFLDDSFGLEFGEWGGAGPIRHTGFIMIILIAAFVITFFLIMSVVFCLGTVLVNAIWECRGSSSQKGRTIEAASCRQSLV